MIDRLLSVKEAAEYLGIKKQTLYVWLRDGEIPFVKLAGSTIRIKMRTLEAYVNARVSTKLVDKQAS